ncbi:MAG: VWA domain-containing protein [bacterium]
MHDKKDIYNATRMWKYQAIIFLLSFVFIGRAASTETITTNQTQGTKQIREAGKSKAQSKLSAMACDSLRVDYYDIDATQFPVITSEVTVYGRDNTSIGGLTENDFAVYENDVLQLPIQVEPFGSDSGGVTIALLMDRSNSMTRALPAVKSTAIAFVNLMLPDDKMAVATFGRDAQLEQNFTANKNALTSAINAISLEPYTALYDGVLFGLELMKDVPGHKAIVLLTDGRDRDSKVRLNDVLNAVSTADIPIFGIGLGLKPDWGEPELRQIAETSGGIYYRSPTTQDLADIYQTIFFVLHRFWYRITYTTNNCAMDGTLRNVRIEARVGNEACQGANSYTAPDHLITLVASADKAPSPGELFNVQLEIPVQSKALLGMTDFRVALLYDKTYLKPQEPYEANIRPGSLLGNSADFTFNFVVDENAGKIIFDFKRKSSASAVSGKGPLAQINFLADKIMPDSTRLLFTVTDLDARNGPDCRIAMQTQDLTLYSDGMHVWPGDTNFNGAVELSDVLVLGLYWAINGPPRPGDEDQLSWMPHRAKKYNVIAATHADADGNGGISERDIIPIGLNWAKTQADFFASNMREKTASVVPDGRIEMAIVPASKADEYILKLFYNTVNNAPMAGTTFKMYYPYEFTIYDIVPGSIWPEKPLLFTHTEKSTNLLALGMMLPASAHAPNMHGELLAVHFAANDFPDVNQFRFQDAALVAVNGQVNEIEIGQDDSINHLELPEKFTLFPAYPNPFNPHTTLRYYLPEESFVAINIYDRAGRLVKGFEQKFRLPGFQTVTWNGRNDAGQFAGSGIYFVEMVAVNNSGKPLVARQKVTLLK